MSFAPVWGFLARLPVGEVLFVFLVGAIILFSLRLLAGLRKQDIKEVRSYKLIVLSFVCVTTVVLSVLIASIVQRAMTQRASADAIQAEDMAAVNKVIADQGAASTRADNSKREASRIRAEKLVLEDCQRILCPVLAAGFRLSNKWETANAAMTQAGTRESLDALFAETLSEVRPQVKSDSQRKSFARLLREVATLDLARDDWHSAEPLLRELLTLKGFATDIDGKEKLLQCLNAQSKDTVEARRLANELDRLAKADPTAAFVRTKDAMVAAGESGDISEYLRLAPKAISLGRQLGRARSVQFIQMELATIYAQQGDIDLAKNLMADCFPEPPQQDAELMCHYGMAHGNIELASKNGERAEGFFNVEYRMEVKLRRLVGQVRALCDIAEARCLRANKAGALNTLGEAEDLLPKIMPAPQMKLRLAELRERAALLPDRPTSLTAVP